MTETRFCIGCRERLAPETRFCPQCGVAIQSRSLEHRLEPRLRTTKADVRDSLPGALGRDPEGSTAQPRVEVRTHALKGAATLILVALALLASLQATTASFASRRTALPAASYLTLKVTRSAGARAAVPGRAYAMLRRHTASPCCPFIPISRTSNHPVMAIATRRGQPLVDRRLTFGRSVQGRPLVAVEIGNPQSARKTVVVGCIHGNECAGLAIVRALEVTRPSRAFDLWIIENMNPDGYAIDTRQNAHRVDLNRNFPWDWQPIGAPGDQQYAGTGPLSEPESKGVYRLLDQIRPRIVVWYHQPEAVVDKSGGLVSVEQRYAALTGLPLQQLTRYPGSATSWADHTFPNETSFVVELPGGALSGADARLHAEAVLTITRELR